MQLVLHKSGKKRAGKLDVEDSVFGVDYNEPLIHQALTAYLAGSRSGTKAQKARSDVRGGGRKPFRQKGTGRARAGTIRSPIWRGGGVTFAARPRNYDHKLNKKMYRGAIRSILSELARQERLLIIDEMKIDEPKTKTMLAQLQTLDLQDVLIVTTEVSENLYLSSRNIPNVDVIDTDEIDPFVLLGFDKILMTKVAVEKVEAWLK